MTAIRRSAVAALALVIVACAKQDPPAPPPPPAGTPALPTGPRIETREFTYTQGKTALKGFIAWGAGVTGKRPGVLVVHEWWGHNEHARNQAKRLAEAGYVGMAIDMYGDGKVTSHPDSAQAFVTEATKSAPVMAERFQAALAQLKLDPHVDSTKVAAIGYCFGGAVVLSMARSGLPLAAVASFHGALAGLAPVAAGKLRARILVQTGEADPMVPAAQVEQFRKEMTAAGARFQIISYPGVKHSFTNPNADHVGMDGLGYNADADAKSWAELVKFFGEVFR
jgi:dienelactone hydrolase